MAQWIEACAADDIDEEDVRRFDYRNGAARGAPVCIDLKTYPVKVESGKVMIDIG